VSASDEYVTAAEAARRLGVSAKALRLYEERGLIRPLRSAAGWRTYGPTQLDAAGEVAALRALGLSLADVAAVLGGDPAALDLALARHQETLETRLRDIAGAMDRVRALRARLATGQPPKPGELPGLVAPPLRPRVALDLPWPWGGERFELELGPITYLVGPLGSGKTRLAEAIAAALPGGVFVGLDRAPPPAIDAVAVETALAWLAGEGATRSDGLAALVAWFEVTPQRPLVVDLVEQGLDQPSQEALASYLRMRVSEAPLVLMTRSTAMLDLHSISTGAAIIYCPANHSPPVLVTPAPGAAGFDLVASCLASPEVRRRTEGVVAMRPAAG
jgi:DNA-binding transcriptional MerR regulator